VQGDVVDLFVGVFQDGRLPPAERGHLPVGAAAGDEADGGVEPFHRSRRLGGKPPVLVGGLVADLPGPVELVAEAPQPHAVGLLGAVLAAQVGQRGAGRVVGVLEQVAGLLHTAGAEVDRQHRLHAGVLRPGHELVEAERVGLHGLPGEVEPPWPVARRTDAVLPAVAGDEVAAGVPHDADAQLADQVEHVRAEAAGVGERMVRLVDAAVDAAAHVLHEGTEQPAVGGADPEGRVDRDRSGLHGGQPFGGGPAFLQRCRQRCKEPSAR
jgi:hypothetical protein